MENKKKYDQHKQHRYANIFYYQISTHMLALLLKKRVISNISNIYYYFWAWMEIRKGIFLVFAAEANTDNNDLLSKNEFATWTCIVCSSHKHNVSKIYIKLLRAAGAYSRIYWEQYLFSPIFQRILIIISIGFFLSMQVSFWWKLSANIKY